jgi:hypothetical protein
MKRALEHVTQALTHHRGLMLQQLETFAEHLAAQRASFDRWAERNTSAVKAFENAAIGHRQAADQLRAAVDAHNRAVTSLAEARVEVEELKAMVTLLLRRKGVNWTPPTSEEH